MGNLKVLVPIGVADDDLCGQLAVFGLLAKNNHGVPNLRDAVSPHPLPNPDRNRAGPSVKTAGIASVALNLKVMIVPEVVQPCLLSSQIQSGNGREWQVLTPFGFAHLEPNGGFEQALC